MNGSPVTEGQFQTGTELMLWRPGLHYTKVRRRALTTSLFSSSAIHVLLGATVIVLGVHSAPAPIGWLCLFGGVLAVGINVLKICVNYRYMDCDHQHDTCFLDKVRGEFFYRTSDFSDLEPAVGQAVNHIIGSVHDVYASPAASWLDSRQMHDIHQVAWDTVHIVDRTRALRDVVTDPRTGATGGDLTLAQSQLAMVDEAVEMVASYLRQAVILTEAWEMKLAEIHLRDRLRVELDAVPHHAIDDAIRRAKSVPEAIFIHITAARDLTDAGLFDWEAAPDLSGAKERR